VAAIHPLPGFDEPHVLTMAALASSDGGQDPVDQAIRSAASLKVSSNPPKLTHFTPFDPATKMSEASATDPSLGAVRIIKGAFAVIGALAVPSPTSAAAANELEAKGFRVLAVAAGPPAAMQLVGLIALSDPAREDSAALVKELKSLGIRTVMVTGDAPATSAIVAHAVGLDGAVCPPGPIPPDVRPETFAVFAGVLPDDKFKLPATSSVCAAMEPTMRPRCARRKWGLRFQRLPMLPSLPPAWSSPILDSPALSPPSRKGASRSSAF
jgi:H+-transporting ATPase